MPRKSLEGVSANNASFSEQEEIRGVFVFLLNGEGEERDPIWIELLPDGSLDLSEIPKYLRTSWESHGERPPFDVGENVMPADGKAFLEILLRRKPTGYGPRFSREPKKRSI